MVPWPLLPFSDLLSPISNLRPGPYPAPTEGTVLNAETQRKRGETQRRRTFFESLRTSAPSALNLPSLRLNWGIAVQSKEFMLIPATPHRIKDAPLLSPALSSILNGREGAETCYARGLAHLRSLRPNQRIAVQSSAGLRRGFLPRALSGSIRFYPWSNSSGGCGFFSGFLCRAVVQVLRRPR